MKWARHPNLRKRPGRASRSPVGHRLYAESEDQAGVDTVKIVLHPAGREAERSELKRAFCSSLSEL